MSDTRSGAGSDAGSEELCGEDAWIADALRAFPAGAATVLGPGHDAAAVRAGADGVLVVAKDVLVDGVHFRLDECGPALAARKALAVNLSDLAAAAAVPVGFLVGAVLPRPADRTLFDALMAGFAAASETFDCACLGGDTNSAESPLVLSVTVLGRPGPGGVLSRSGARIGDLLSVTGPLGGSGHGRHLTFRPRLREAQVLAGAGIPHAMMDLSDGLSRDLPRLCRASGIGALVFAEDLPIHSDTGGASTRTPLERALHDGEDFELLVAHAALEEDERAALAADGVTLHTIGRCTEADDGVRLSVGGQTVRIEPAGWDHVSA